MKPLFLALLLLIPVIASGQQTAPSDLPTYDTMDSIKQHRRVYVASDNDDSRERIIKALGKDKSLVVVNSPDEAQFFIQYEELSREATGTGQRTKERQQRSQMRVFTVASDRKIIIWSETSSRDTEHFMGMKMYDSGRSESKLTEKFLKALKKARGEKSK